MARPLRPSTRQRQFFKFASGRALVVLLQSHSRIIPDSHLSKGVGKQHQLVRSFPACFYSCRSFSIHFVLAFSQHTCTLAMLAPSRIKQGGSVWNSPGRPKPLNLPSSPSAFHWASLHVLHPFPPSYSRLEGVSQTNCKAFTLTGTKEDMQG